VVAELSLLRDRRFRAVISAKTIPDCEGFPEVKACDAKREAKNRAPISLKISKQY
jgi:hypothetical protein